MSESLRVVKDPPLFHEMDDVLIPASGEFGYVFALTQEADRNMALVKSHDGHGDGWYNVEELQHLEKKPA